MAHLVTFGLSLVVGLVVPVLAWSQTAPPAGAFVLGSASFTPRSSLSVGTDSNVFNQTSDPQSDRIFTFDGGLDTRFQLRRANFQATTEASYFHYQRFARERWWNPSQAVRLELPFNRVIMRG